MACSRVIPATPSGSLAFASVRPLWSITPRRGGPQPSHHPRTALLLPSSTSASGSSPRENHQRPTESEAVLTPPGGARHPISDQLSRPTGRGTIFHQDSRSRNHECSPAGGYLPTRSVPDGPLPELIRFVDHLDEPPEDDPPDAGRPGGQRLSRTIPRGRWNSPRASPLGRRCPWTTSTRTPPWSTRRSAWPSERDRRPDGAGRVRPRGTATIQQQRRVPRAVDHQRTGHRETLRVREGDAGHQREMHS